MIDQKRLYDLRNSEKINRASEKYRIPLSIPLLHNGRGRMRQERERDRKNVQRKKWQKTL